MSAGTMNDNAVLPVRVLVAIVAVVTVAVAGFVVLYGLTPPADRPGLLDSIGKAWPALSAAAATFAAILAGKAHQGNKRQEETLRVVERQTNGDLDRRMAETFAAELDARGLVPRQRVDDTAPAVPVLPVTAAGEPAAPVEGQP